MTLTPQEIRHYAKSLPDDQDKTEVRLVAAVITGLFLYKFIIEPLFSMLTLPTSMIAITAKMGHSEYWVVASFVLSALLMAPHLVSLIAVPESLHKRWPRKCAARGSILASVTWACLGANAMPLDTAAGPVVVFYWINAFICAVVGGVYGFSLNSQQLRLLSQTDEDTKGH